MKRILCILALALAATLAGCGSTATEGGAGPETDRTKYPPGPYGTKAGQIVEEREFQALDGSVYGLGEVFANPQHRLMLLSSIAGWCAPCIHEQPQLAALHDEFSDNGLIVMAAMFEDSDYRTASLDYLREWKTEHELPYTLVLDAPYRMLDFYDGNPPLNMVIDVDTMKILYVGAGFNEDAIRGVVKRNLDI